MLSNSDDKTEIKNVDDIKEHLKTLRNNPSAYKKEFVYPFLGKDIIEDKLQSDKNQIQNTIIAEERYDRFCNAYLIEIFLTFLSANDAEIMLMIYGLLDNFDIIRLGDRREEYWQYAHTYNSRLQGSKNQDKDNLLRGIENNIIDNLANILIELKSDSIKMSNFTNMVFEGFINNKIPEKISPPITEYLQRNDNFRSLNFDSNKIFSDSIPSLLIEQENKESATANLPHNNKLPKKELSFLKIIKSKFAVKRKGEKIRAKFEVDFEIDINDLKKGDINKRIIAAAKEALEEVTMCIVIFIVLPSIYLQKTKTSESNNQTDNTYVREEPQRSSVPDVTKSSDGGIEYDNREKNGELETSF